MVKSYTSLFFCVFSSSCLFSQYGGNTTYKFLSLPVSARVAALGGYGPALKDGDVNLALQNPSLLDSTMNNCLGLSYINYFADINYGYAGYARHYTGIGSFGVGVQFINYGKFTSADPTGTITGQFKAAEYAFNLGYGKKLDSVLSVGANVKVLYSALEQYYSSALAADVGITYQNIPHFFTAALIIKNTGVQLKSYTEGNKEPLPFEVQAGISRKLSKAPFRFSITFQHLEKWDMTYDDPNDPNEKVNAITGEVEHKRSKTGIFTDKLMRHVVPGVEILISKNIHLRVGYNYQRRQELKLENRPGMTGFSFGLGIKISKFQLSYGRASYHLAGASNHFTISTNLNDFYSRK